MRKDTRLSPLYRTGSDGKLGGPGNEASAVVTDALRLVGLTHGRIEILLTIL